METQPVIATLHFHLFRELPDWAFCLTVVALFVIFALAGQAMVRPLLKRWFGEREFNDLVGIFISVFGVLYGITLGLISVAAWTNFGEVEGIVSQEAASVAALYHCVEDYPEPLRTELTGILHDYTRQVIEVCWPQMHQGIVPTGGDEFIQQFEQRLVSFEPHTTGEITLHRETLYRFNQMIEFRSLRIDCVAWQLPSILWVVVLAGSIMSVVLTWLLVLENAILHHVLTAIMAMLLGTLIFFLLTLDLPFEGHHHVGADSFELIYEHVMTAK